MTVILLFNSLRPSDTYMRQKLTTIGSDNGLSPGRRQAIIWTSAWILLIGPLGTIFNEIFTRNPYIFIQENAFENVVWKMAANLSRPQCFLIKKNVIYIQEYMAQQ